MKMVKITLISMFKWGLKMRFLHMFQSVAFFAVVVVVMASTVRAGSLTDLIWGPPYVDPVRPYLEEAKIPHNSRWANDGWHPQDWIDSRGGKASNVMDGLYDANIITDQYIDDSVHVLEVGQGFIELGAEDKRRVVSFVDDVFKITKTATPGVIMVLFHEDDERIGIFNAQGLQLQ